MTEPYYQDDQVTLYCGDCLEIDAWLKADVLVTDPPYGMAFQSGHRAESFAPISGDKDTTVRDDALTQWAHTGQRQRAAACFGTWRANRPDGVKQVLIWNKRGVGPGMGDLSMAFGSSHEEIYLIGEWRKRATRRGSVITTESSPSELTTRIGHPTPKPVGLMEILIEAAPVGVIADPFAGGGSTLVAARNLGRNAIGVEVEERYCDLIAKRLDQLAFDFGRAQ